MDSIHWADEAASRVLETFPNERFYTVASGITPSGVVHIGNFREVITADLVARALQDRGVPVRFIFSWDDFDVFRKVPADMPESLREHLRCSISQVPDPHGCHDSFAGHHIADFEASLFRVGIDPTFIRQSKRYCGGVYNEEIMHSLQQKDKIRGILNQARDETTAHTLLSEDWLPLAGFCTGCGRDKLQLECKDARDVSIRCLACDKLSGVDLRYYGNLKLPWRLDWPMRWAFERVCFEPGGKDHSSAGGSYDTAKILVREIYGWQPPVYLGYDFVRIKGQDGKISSSKGHVVTVDDCLGVYEPEVLRWIFVSRRPDTEFQISFDFADVLKIYEEFDRTVRDAIAGNSVAQRTMQLSSVERRPDPRAGHRNAHPRTGVLPSFRDLITTVQIYEGDLDRTVQHYIDRSELNEADRPACRLRATCVWSWLAHHATEDLRFQLRTTPKAQQLTEDQALCLQRLVAALEAAPTCEAELVPTMKALCAGTSLSNKTFLPVVYDLLLGQDKGPKLTTLIMAAGPSRIAELLKPSL